MSKVRDGIDDELAEWIRDQHVFFVATAPLSEEGHINCSPKGGDSFLILGPTEVAYLDYTGSGAETAAHVQENGRIVIMFCAFKGRPDIARLHGVAELLMPNNSEYERLYDQFKPNPGARAIIRVKLDRVSTSCGFSVPLLDFVADRPVLDNWAKSKGSDSLKTYRADKNAVSIDGLPALPTT